MVSLSESFRRLCYVGSYQADRDNRLSPTEKSGVDCTNEWYLGGVFVYILAAILSCVCRNCIKLVRIIESIWSGSIDIRIMVTYIPCHYAVEWKNYLYIWDNYIELFDNILGIWILWSFNSSESSVKHASFCILFLNSGHVYWLLKSVNDFMIC